MWGELISSRNCNQARQVRAFLCFDAITIVKFYISTALVVLLCAMIQERVSSLALSISMNLLQSTKNQNFQNIKIGDIIAVTDRTSIMLLEVTKVTKATFATEKHVFNKSNGELRGSSRDPWSHVFAWIPTEEEKQEIEKAIQMRRLQVAARFRLQQVGHSVDTLSEDDLKTLINQLHSYMPKR
jgi:hypothetical protein